MDLLDPLLTDLEINDQIWCFILRSAGSDVFISGDDLHKFHPIKPAEKAPPMMALELNNQIPSKAGISIS